MIQQQFNVSTTYTQSHKLWTKSQKIDTFNLMFAKEEDVYTMIMARKDGTLRGVEHLQICFYKKKGIFCPLQFHNISVQEKE